ncbi:tetratricopeptide repeat protein [Fulvivirgaceae bacterium BMA10]|uniref:Tetratricopeptide repeat protein n=1 Tax=Splendidivirga corallicola TaxID=3051826 RepID=A0ABT8KLZ0_9BACT|nr:tetratricopeptide repeat protein [Fulvivirgaceae bacterium BMA10]
MENEIRDIALIEQYLEGKLTTEELEEFEVRLQNDELFKKLFDQEETLIAGIRYTGRKGILDKLEAMEEKLPKIDLEKPSEGKVVPMRRRTYLIAIAASIALLLVTVFVLNKPTNSEVLFAKHFTPYQNLITSNTRGEVTIKELKELAFLAYDQENYTEAISNFEKLPQEQKNEDIFLYLGNAYLAVGKTEEAIQNFSKVLEEKGDFQNQGRWFLALAYLKQGETQKATLAFEKLVEDGSSYGKRAAEVLKEMR